MWRWMSWERVSQTLVATEVVHKFRYYVTRTQAYQLYFHFEAIAARSRGDKRVPAATCGHVCDVGFVIGDL